MSEFKGLLRKLAFFFGLLSLGSTAILFALDPTKKISQYGYSEWSRLNGLPANAVRAVMQTHDGYLWLGTTAGLLRFDGVRFEVMGTDAGNSKNRELITALCETHDSTLWIGTAYDGLRRIKNGKLIPCSPADGFLRKSIKALIESREGHLWIGSSDGLFEYIDGRCIARPIESPFISSLTEDRFGRMFIGTGKGVHYFDETQPQEIRSIFRKDGLPQEDITSIFADDNGYVWVGSQSGITRWSNGKVLPETSPGNPGNIHITSIHEDRNNNIWVGTAQGIFRFSGGEWLTMKASQGFLSDNILSLFEDHEGSLWICTSEGLCRFRDVNITSYTTQEGLAHNFVTSVFEGPDSSMYLLSAASGGNISKLKNGILTQFPDPPPVGPSYLARDGSIWTSQSGFLSQIKNGHVIRYDTTTGLPHRWISAITEDSISLIIYLDRIGIRRFIRGRLNPYMLADGKAYASAEFVSSFHMDHAGGLWIGTTDGLVKIQNGRSRTYRTADGLADDWIRSFYEDRRGHLWFGSPRGGLTHYRDGKFIAYTTKHGLFTNEIYCVLVDDAENVWLSSPEGIGCINRTDIENYEAGTTDAVQTQLFTTADGMRTDECFGSWQPAGWKSHNGRLWFATAKGAVTIDPKTFHRNTVPPPVYIDQFIADTQTVGLDRFESFSPGIEKLEFRYTALSYLVPDRVFFKYQLEGFDRAWVDAGTRRVAYYTNLPPGKYKFRVTACNNDGVWNESGASYFFELSPHFYESVWFLGIVVLLLGGSAFGLFRLRMWQLLRREKDLERHVHDRTRQLEAANQELEAFSYSVSHDLRAPLRSINGFSAALLEDYADTLDEQGKGFLDRVRDASREMEELIDAMLELSRVMRSEMQRASIDLSELARSIAAEFKRTEPDRNVIFDIAPGLVVHADPHLMRVVMDNLLDNAWKFTRKHPAARIEVGSVMEDGQNVYFIRDDGDGFEMAYASKLFGAFQRLHTTSEFEGTGVGLATVRRIIHRHGGRIWAEAEKGKGATFYFTIP